MLAAFLKANFLLFFVFVKNLETCWPDFVEEILGMSWVLVKVSFSNMVVNLSRNDRTDTAIESVHTGNILIELVGELISILGVSSETGQD